FKCRKLNAGHIARNCPEQTHSMVALNAVTTSATQDVNAQHCYPHELAFHPSVEMENKPPVTEYTCTPPSYLPKFVPDHRSAVSAPTSNKHRTRRSKYAVRKACPENPETSTTRDAESPETATPACVPTESPVLLPSQAKDMVEDSDNPPRISLLGTISHPE